MQKGSELREFREKLFWSQSMLADALGVTTTTVWRWEKCNTLPRTCLLRLRTWAKAKAKNEEAKLPKQYELGRPRLDQF